MVVFDYGSVTCRAEQAACSTRRRGRSRSRSPSCRPKTEPREGGYGPLAGGGNASLIAGCQSGPGLTPDALPRSRIDPAGESPANRQVATSSTMCESATTLAGHRACLKVSAILNGDALVAVQARPPKCAGQRVVRQTLVAGRGAEVWVRAPAASAWRRGWQRGRAPSRRETGNVSPAG